MRPGHANRANLYEAAKGTDLRARAAMGAPLTRGVQGRDQALGNMDTRARERAEIKTKFRAAGKPVPRPQFNGQRSTNKQIKMMVKKAN